MKTPGFGQPLRASAFKVVKAEMCSRLVLTSTRLGPSPPSAPSRAASMSCGRSMRYPVADLDDELGHVAEHPAMLDLLKGAAVRVLARESGTALSISSLYGGESGRRRVGVTPRRQRRERGD